MPRSLTLLVTAAALAASTATLQAQTTPSTGGGTGTGTGSTGSGTSGSGTSGSGSTGSGSSMGGAMGSSMSGQDSTGAMHGSTSRRGSMGRSAADPALVAELDSVNTAAKAGLTNLAPSAAAALVGSIQSKLAGSQNASLKSISSDLSALQTELSAGTVNGARVGAILRRLGPKTSAVARTQSGMLASTLRQVGSQLTAASKQLTGGGAAAAAPAGTR